MANFNIAIDGPAGAGKSTIAKLIAKSLNIIYIDTGAMYRVVALKAIQSGCEAFDEVSVNKIIENIDICIKYLDGEQRIFLEGLDVSDKIRTPEISKGTAEVATITKVRLKMVELQRELAKHTNVVMDGRDIGTYVLPDAEIKIFLTADLNERAKRRYEELVGNGNLTVSLDEVLTEMEKRDQKDSKRAFAPLAKAEDAIEIDTTFLSVNEVAEKIISIFKNRG